MKNAGILCVGLILAGVVDADSNVSSSAPSNPPLSESSSAAIQKGIAKISGEECEKAMAGIRDPQSIFGARPRYLKDVYAIMNNAVYYFRSIYSYGETDCEKIIGADPSTFVVYGRDPAYTHWYWAKDKSTVYYGDKILRDADVKTFQVLDYSWGKDKNYVYLKGDLLEGVDATTFQIFANGGFAHDKNHVYQVAYVDSKTPGLEIIPNIDADTFTLLHAERLSSANVYVKDKNAVFFDMGNGLVKMEGADPATFHVLGSCFAAHGMSGSYAKDKNHVYCGEQILADADNNSFKYVGELDYEDPTGGPLFIAKDKRCVWHRHGKVLDPQGKCVSPSNCTSQIIADARKINRDVNSNNLKAPVCGVNRL